MECVWAIGRYFRFAEARGLCHKYTLPEKKKLIEHTSWEDN